MRLDEPKREPGLAGEGLRRYVVCVKHYWVYIVRCADGSFYVGVTSALDRRIAEHNLGLLPAAYTHSRRPVALEYAQEYCNPTEAIAAEKKIKGWSRAKKIALINGDWGEIRRLAAKKPAFYEP